MSNPAVIYLAECKTKSGGSFRIEDNIGEAIHLHYENFRIDLTSDQFLSLGALINNAISEIIDVKDFDLKYFDPVFLANIGEDLTDLREMRFENILLNNLKIQRKGIFNLTVVSKLSKSRVIRAIKGDPKENDSYMQSNNYSESNQDRVDSIVSKIKSEGYPFNDQYIVLFNNQNIIRDGQHRASALYIEGETKMVPVIRLIFTNNAHNMSNYPWLRVLFYWNKKRIRSIFIRFYIKINRAIKRRKSLLDN